MFLAGYLEKPKRGFYQIGSKGAQSLHKGSLPLKELKNQPEYQTHQAFHHQKSGKEDEATEENTPIDNIDKGIQAIEQEIKNKLLEKISSINPYDFEKVILDLLQAMGYGDTISTAKSNDGGIDGIVNEDKLGLDKIYIQAKRFNEGKVREKEIRDFIGAMSGDTSKGIFVTTSDFDHKAIEKVKTAHHKIRLINGAELVKLMYDYGIGVQVESIIKIKKVNSGFFEEQ